jgi:peptide/nickel transport system permease protein
LKVVFNPPVDRTVGEEPVAEGGPADVVVTGDDRGLRDPAIPRKARRGVGRYMAGRLGQGVFVLFGAVTISFLLIHVTGNPATVLAGSSVPPAQVRELSARLGYNHPLLAQYGSYVWHVLHGNFGYSFTQQGPAIDGVMAALPNTLILISISLTAAITISIVIASSSVLKERGWADRVWRPTTLVLQGIPDFWVAIVLVYVLSVTLRLLPSFGFAGPETLIMPCIALTLPMLASFTRLLRGNLLDFMNSDVAFALRTRGLTRREILFGHGLRNAMVTFVSYVALQTGWLIGGTLIVETIFAWPGMGTLLVNSVHSRDLTIIQAIVVVIAVSFVVLNLLADVAILWLDPRIGRGARSGT